ncbi:hypothetical protein HX109_13845 [Galbibacter sp. BG1]|uniref:hypothetical protein n=1 Tax=Galbibacter sp. BG1 TaxID=1170699 RepID=UPI0015B79D17|nr:hypothetical protein [Galbibacter sp. BG1]QLE02590.1 hypothetical protein HX109_13845 [Galbibacter sp. BG1]
MELDEMKAVWLEMSDQLAQQKILTNTLIMEMTRERYQGKINILAKYEGIGALICFAAALTILFKITTLDTWYLMASGIFTIAYLIVMPFLVLQSIQQMKQVNILNTTYKEALVAYTKLKIRFLRVQKIGIYLNFVLLLVSLPLVFKLFKGIDIFKSTHHILYWYVPIMLVFLVLFSKWGYGKYKNVTNAASRVLNDLEKVE